MPNLNTPFVLKVLIDLVVGREITKDGPDKVQANATTAIAVALAVSAAVDDPVSGIAAIDAVLSQKETDPAKVAALQTLITWTGARIAALQALGSGLIISTLIGEQIKAACAEAISVAQKYLPASGPAPAVGAPQAVAG
jgi:hypothetical protein